MQKVIAPSFALSTSAYSIASVAVKTVVKNDTSASVKKDMPVFAAIEQMVVEHEAWHNGAFRTSNEQLYVLLQSCYALYKGMEGTSKDAEEKRKGLQEYINLKALRVQSGTHTLNKIVKCVFGVDRRRASAYALALRVAATKKITVESLPAFIRDAGGVEEVRRTAAEVNHNIISAPQKVAIASDAVAQMSIAVISGEQLGMALDLGNIGKNVVLLGTWQADGSVVVRAVVQNDSAVNSALAGYYSSNKGAVQAKATEAVAANDANLVQQAINQAAAA